MYQIYILYIIVITKLAPILVNKSHFFSHFFVHFSTHKKAISSSSTSNPPQCQAPQEERKTKIMETFLSHLSPFQTRVYCQPLTSKQKARLPAGQSMVFYNHRKPIGKNTIRLMIKDACKKLGFPDATGHGFRRLFITTLANDSGVSVEESMKSSGHNSVAAQRTYMVTNGVSETNKFKALGLA